MYSMGLVSDHIAILSYVHKCENVWRCRDSRTEKQGRGPVTIGVMGSHSSPIQKTCKSVATLHIQLHVITSFQPPVLWWLVTLVTMVAEESVV